MIKHPRTKLLDGRFWAVFIFTLVLVLLLFSSMDMAAQEPSLPLSPPDAANGLTVFADRCANCHGATGGGDGELSGQLMVAPAHVNDPPFRETAVPGDLFDTITNGILESGMPPFGSASSNPLDDATRWDLVAAV
ncbi:MAG: cytochrome c, partial [Anaerolineae bacterium]